MSTFTVVIIIWVIYQLGISLLKKSNQQTPGKSSGPLKLPDARSIREVLQETPQGSWREQMQQVLKNTSRQVEEWTGNPGPLKSTEARAAADDNTQAARTPVIRVVEGNWINQGVQGTNVCEEPPGLRVNHSTEERPDGEMPRGSQARRGTSLCIRESELVQGVVWAEILGKPRALRPFRGPRS